MSEAVKVYVGMGSNLGNSKQHMVDALKELNELPDTRVTACSSLYSTRPVGPQDQNYFINAVVELETTREAHELLHMLFDIENRHHRLRLRHWGERTMDLDILYEDEDLILINKPKGMVVHPAAGHYEGTLVNGLMYHCKDQLSGINGVMRHIEEIREMYL